MATRFVFFTGLFLLVLIGAFGLAGCADDGAASDANLPPPSFVSAPVNPQPAPRMYVAPAPSPVLASAQQPRQASTWRPAAAQYSPLHTRLSYWQQIPASWVPHAQPRDWQWIVIHHTATSFGNAAIVTRWHIDRGFDEMGYHFLIGNGTNSGDGQVEVGTRWPKQKWGAHTKSPDNRFNDYGIGICLVGNFDVQYPSHAQLHSLEKLVAYLMKTYHIPPSHVLGHNDCKATDCPGRNLHVAEVRNAAVEILASEGYTFAAEPRLAASDELMHDIRR